MTPEGVMLPFELASVFDRLAALVIDLLLIHVGVAVVFVAALASAGAGFGWHAVAAAMLASFMLRNFYFAYFEIRNGGTTPGKRRMSIRVVSRSGATLAAESVLARNLTREFEIFLPIVVMASPGSVLPSLPEGAALLGSVWLLVGALLPLFNRNRLRLGDLLGGTIVVAIPRAVLLADPAATPPAAAPARPAQRFSFTDEQLDQYGIQELQVLEDLVRRSSPADAGVPLHEREVLEAVVQKVRDKIAWQDPVPPADVALFLGEFYRQLRAHLEHKALFGVRQLRKKEGKLERGSAGSSNR